MNIAIVALLALVTLLALVVLNSFNKATILESNHIDEKEPNELSHVLDVDNYIVLNSTSTIMTNIATTAWSDKITGKLLCLYKHQGGLYFYHNRKAAGTTVQEILKLSSWIYGIKKVYFTEGITLDPEILEQSGLMSVISFRDPIDRIVSLYWYDYANSYKKNQSLIYTMNEWFDAWKDGSKWKSSFIKKNLKNVYVEVDNYYTKVLSSWSGPEPINSTHLEIAKSNLEKFDIIFIQEWMKSLTQTKAMEALFPGIRNLTRHHEVIADKLLRKKNTHLVINEEEFKNKMAEINKYDLLLYGYAMAISARRLLLVDNIVNSTQKNGEKIKGKLDPKQCKISIVKAQVGLYQPPGHKGPKKTIDLLL